MPNVAAVRLLPAAAALVALPALPACTAARSAEPQKPPASLVTADNGFAFRLFHDLTQHDGSRNVFLSPASVAFALDMTYNGAGGDTAKAMARTLGLTGMKLADVNAGNAALRDTLTRNSAGVEITTANALWADRRVRFAPDFAARARKFYGANVSTLDLSGPAAPGVINGWVKRETRGKIPTLVTRSDLSSSDAVLTNAIYFKGVWRYAFETSKTRAAPFMGLRGTKQVPMMHQTLTVPYYDDGSVQVVSLPYGDGGASMVIALPGGAAGLSDLVAGLTPETWNHWMSVASARKLDLSLPRFKVAGDFELVPTLSRLGMAKAFGRGADFGPMGLSGSFISNVKHKAVMEVNEEGTEAAAATGVIMQKAMPLKPRVVVDHPFFCAIRDNRSGAILFIGAMNEVE